MVVCKQCREDFQNRDDLEIHREATHLKCICGNYFANERTHAHHFHSSALHTYDAFTAPLPPRSRTPIPCLYYECSCGNSFLTSEERNPHRRSSSAPRPHVSRCKCGETFQSEAKSQHIDNSFPPEVHGYDCMCGRNFPTEYERKHHVLHFGLGDSHRLLSNNRLAVTAAPRRQASPVNTSARSTPNNPPVVAEAPIQQAPSGNAPSQSAQNRPPVVTAAPVQPVHIGNSAAQSETNNTPVAIPATTPVQVANASTQTSVQRAIYVDATTQTFELYRTDVLDREAPREARQSGTLFDASYPLPVPPGNAPARTAGAISEEAQQPAVPQPVTPTAARPAIPSTPPEAEKELDELVSTTQAWAEATAPSSPGTTRSLSMSEDPVVSVHHSTTNSEPKSLVASAAQPEAAETHNSEEEMDASQAPLPAPPPASPRTIHEPATPEKIQSATTVAQAHIDEEQEKEEALWHGENTLSSSTAVSPPFSSAGIQTNASPSSSRARTSSASQGSVASSYHTAENCDSSDCGSVYTAASTGSVRIESNCGDKHCGWCKIVVFDS